MKLVILAAVAVMASGAMAKEVIKGKLTVLPEAWDAPTAFRCSLPGNKNEINVTLDTATRLLSLEVSGVLAFPSGARVRMTGPYMEVERQEKGKLLERHYQMHPAGYDLSLFYVGDEALPRLTLAWGAKEYRCQ